MLLKMLNSFAGPNFSYVNGDVAEIPDATAKSWIKHGLAEPADPQVKAPSEELEPPVPDPTAPAEEIPTLEVNSTEPIKPAKK
jgi:hypothetical protein